MTAKYLPLYKQVYDELLKRISQAYWKAGDSLPSEFALAAELNVSQGTVRKALNQLVDESILRRRQGKGTYVNEHTQESSLYRFFRYRETGGARLIPETTLLSRKVRASKAQERSVLNLSVGDKVHEATRLRHVNGKPIIFETVVQPLTVFPGIDKEQDLPNSLYGLYQEKFGISIVEVRDELKAVSLPPEAAKHLRLEHDSPALRTERLSINIDGRAVERSCAYCNTENFVYAVTVK